MTAVRSDLLLSLKGQVGKNLQFLIVKLRGEQLLEGSVWSSELGQALVQSSNTRV